MIIKRDGCTKGVADYYVFRIDVNADSTAVHIFLDEYYRTLGNKILSSSPRWRRNDDLFSNMTVVPIPQNVKDEVVDRLKASITLHYPDKDEDDVV